MRIIAIAAAALAGCTTTPVQSPQDQLFAAVSSHCGHSLNGRLLTDDPQDAALIGKPLVARFAGCTADEVRINIAAGDDTSRTWVISRTPDGLRLKHLHLHKDGTEEELSRYGGDTMTRGTAQRQEFPVDDFTKELFTRLNRPGNNNVYAVEARAGEFYVHELRRPGRYFRAEFHRPR